MISLNLFFNVMAFIVGGCVGSFLNVCIWRLPQKKSIVSPPSACPACAHPIPWYDNIPILSWVILRGKCRHCQKSISCRYVLIEALTAVVFILVFRYIWRYNLPLSFYVPYIYMVTSLSVIAWLDYNYRLIPNIITLAGILLAFLWGTAFPETHRFSMFAIAWEHSMTEPFITDRIISYFTLLRGQELLPHLYAIVNIILGMICGGGLLAMIGILTHLLVSFTCRKQKGTHPVIGMGDIKLMAMVGAFLGPLPTLIILFLSSISGVAVGVMHGLYQIVCHQRAAPRYIPYGIFISITTITYLFAGNRLLKFLFPS